MDKYTVDLDKVLNDFEFSEYSLESSKVNKNVEVNSQTGYSSSAYLSNRVDTNVKHSITNVFHSLNEYLSSEITTKPSKFENLNSTQADSNDVLTISNETFFEKDGDSSIGLSKHLSESESENKKFLDCNNLDESLEKLIAFESVDVIQDVQSSSSDVVNDKIHEYNNNVVVSLKLICDDVDKNYSQDLRSNITEEDFVIEKIDNGDKKSLLVIKDFADKIEISENLCDVQADCEQLEENKHETTEIQSKECDINSAIETKMILYTEEGKLSFDEKCDENVKLEELVDLKAENHNNKHDGNEKLESTEETCVITTSDFKHELDKEHITLGFNNVEVEIDEDKLDDYFNELEIELEEDSRSIRINDILEERKNGTSENFDNNVLDDEKKVNMQKNYSTSEHLGCDTIIKNISSDILEEKLCMEKEVTVQCQEGLMRNVDRKNSLDRPQNLELSPVEVKESVGERKQINLIGEPGSTPYNNVYVDKELTEEKVYPSKERSSSPSYSDVSTESLTSDTTSSDVSLPLLHSGERIAGEGVAAEPCEETVGENTTDENRDSNKTTEEAACELNESENRKEGNDNSKEREEIDVTNENSAGGDAASEGNEERRETNDGIENENVNPRNLDWLGKQAPLWIPDSQALSCLHCDMKFTVLKRRHHCRACGLVLCAKCCHLKCRLDYLEAEVRICHKCYDVLSARDGVSGYSYGGGSSGSEVTPENSPTRSGGTETAPTPTPRPNPNNPQEYCSTVSPLVQEMGAAAAAPSVMVPVGVLKRKGSNKGRSNKSVMFCDGIRPGSDLTNLDTDFNYNENANSVKSIEGDGGDGDSPIPVDNKPIAHGEKSIVGRCNAVLDPVTKSFIPKDEKNLPPEVVVQNSDIKFTEHENNSELMNLLKSKTMTFAIQNNLNVRVKIFTMDCCVNKTVWCFSTEGLINVGQDEIVILLETTDEECTLPKDVFVHVNYVYSEAVKGNSIKEMGISLHDSSSFLDSKNHAGFVYIRPTFQCLQNIIVPQEPYLIGILIHRWETPWAKLFPLRLVLRLGAEYRYYPSPIISTRHRDSVFVELGHTIINLLADFRNFSYTLPQIRGLSIHMEDKSTTVTIPSNRYDQVLKSLSNSSDHILSFAGNFSSEADSHLVCIQNTQSNDNKYSTHAINIHNKPRKVTGASFIVFNGALKSSSGLTAKSNIVEDGLMIQIPPERMIEIREALRNMKNHTIQCGCVDAVAADETVVINWGEPDSNFNAGVLSPIDNLPLNGIPSIRVHNGKDYANTTGYKMIRWTEVFIIQSGEESNRNQDPIDISKISESIAKASCQALVKYLALLVTNNFQKIAIRATLHVENVSYMAGSNNTKLPPLYMKSLDNELIPTLHRITSNNLTENAIVLELIFRILNV